MTEMFTSTSRTSPTASSPSSGSDAQKTTAFIGAVVALISFFLLLLLGFLLLRRARKTQVHTLLPFPIATRRLSPRSGKRRSDHSISGSTVVQEGDQIPSEETVLLAGPSRARADDTVAEILRLSVQLRQLIAERASVWLSDRDFNPPPAYVDEGTEDALR
ncbi:hypothetical protein IW261DRAFT_1597296 [Armillaria novae-zelandiae]|uniref:Uncharacterized protein n=1 Tax=Armillaria novae-zelandiae TaxID=153914 RepID=A0AA39NTQ7_9AGAR|nr:hypothetical protein IW261DRAFT_1597296 [Armillaria novae-zelandiae]